MGIQNQKFVITGAAEGMGAATAKLACQKGAKVCLADINEERGKAITEEICDAGGAAWFIACDVTDTAQLNNLMNQAAIFMGGIDVLHNNAGVIDPYFGDKAALTVETFDRKVWDRVIAVNLTAPMFAAKAAVPYLKQSKNPSIINAASTAAFVAIPSGVAYSSSKAGIAALTKSLAVELAPFGIRSNAYCPGVIETGMLKRFLSTAPNAESVVKELISTHLVPRLGQPEEIAELVCFLAGDESRFINGVVWLIDGGSLAWLSGDSQHAQRNGPSF
jgi:NAD(P)-dependent dehydrogenase (short-subunit alcohol dehydrogenase family)